jgi:hypothetical protein
MLAKYARNRSGQSVKKFLLAMALSCAATMCRADGLFLAAGRSLTILDAADPTVRVVLNAPADAPLDLGSLLVTGPNDSVYAIVTRIQVNGADGLSRAADGSVGLSGGARAAATPANTLQGGVLVFAAGKFTYHAVPVTSAGAVAPVPGPPPGASRLVISRPGATKAQAERDIAQCRRYAEQAGAQFLRAADRVAMVNAAMHSCLKSFGYEIHAPAA